MKCLKTNSKQFYSVFVFKKKQFAIFILNMDFDYLKFFKIPKLLVKKIGFWHDDTSKKHKMFAFLVHLFLIEYNTLSFGMKSFKMWQHGAIREFSDAFQIFMLTVSLSLRSIWFVMKLEKIKKVFIVFEELLKFSAIRKIDNRAKLEAHMKRTVKILITFIVVCFGSNLVAALMALINFRDRTLPYETWCYWDYKHNDWLYWLLTFQLYFASSYASAINCGVDGIPMVFMSFTAGIIDELAEEINSIEIDDKEAYERLCHCIKLHIKIKSFCEEIAENLSFTLFVQTFLNCLILCTSAFLLTTVSFHIYIDDKHVQYFSNRFRH
jgi:hypothetical protein